MTPIRRPNVVLRAVALAVVTLATSVVAGLALSAPAGAATAPLPAGIALPVVASASPGPSGSASTAPPSAGGDVRRGNTPAAPDPGKPGWVWWGAGALAAAFIAGGVRFWRHRDFLVDDVADADADDEYANADGDSPTAEYPTADRASHRRRSDEY